MMASRCLPALSNIPQQAIGITYTSGVAEEETINVDNFGNNLNSDSTDVVNYAGTIATGPSISEPTPEPSFEPDITNPPLAPSITLAKGGNKQPPMPDQISDIGDTSFGYLISISHPTIQPSANYSA